MSGSEKMPYEEVKRRAHEIYAAKIRPCLSPGDERRYVKIDVQSGDYEIGDNSAETRIRLRKRHPDAVIHTIRNHESYTIRLGFRAEYGKIKIRRSP